MIHLISYLFHIFKRFIFLECIFLVVLEGYIFVKCIFFLILERKDNTHTLISFIGSCWLAVKYIYFFLLFLGGKFFYWVLTIWKPHCAVPVYTKHRQLNCYCPPSVAPSPELHHAVVGLPVPLYAKYDQVRTENAKVCLFGPCSLTWPMFAWKVPMFAQ